MNECFKLAALGALVREMLCRLDWLSDEYWIKFQVMVQTFKAFCSLGGPTDLEGHLLQYVPRRALSSSDQHLLAMWSLKDIPLASI